MSPRAYDLIGTIESPAEVFPRLEAIEQMVITLQTRGLVDAAEDTRELLEEARTFAAAMCDRTSRLHGLWKAIEMADSPYTPPSQATRDITTAAVSYRAVREQGTRRS